MSQHRPDVPQPDPVVHDNPGDVPLVPEYEPLDDQPGVPLVGEKIPDSEPSTY
ncbi:hypothetical protein [Pseudomonas sp. PIC25]|uniref:hypothetical protein n=1 Tax=Pseudomonas sp. PIC25 TaxID=1958773 RepID=UPI00143CE2FB|nr:hypothetical protein [Pseudomonas sp. PIC25]